ncbi:hypothetical protein EDB19DRAFT_2036413 [Suillus lakei]|nr:hypothetical protein EDB19DRAFT_2036413 [Suillus lakei]
MPAEQSQSLLAAVLRLCNPALEPFFCEQRANEKRTGTGEASVRPSIDVAVVGTQTPGQGSVPPTPGAESLDPVAKKARNLNKNLKAIDELKEKGSRGERLEATQLEKMEGEAEICKELSSLRITA